MKKFSYIIPLFVSLLFLPSAWAEDTSDPYCDGKNDFELYECRVENICEGYKSEKPTIKPEKYEEADSFWQSYVGQDTQAPALEKAKEIYRKNMGEIYKCAMIQAQKNSLDFLKKQLKAEKSGKLDDTIGRQVELRISRLDIAANKVGCTLSDKKTVYNKLNLLKETTYEMCKHVSYMEYLKYFYSNNPNALWLNNPNVNEDFNQEYVPKDVARTIVNIDRQIAEEISHTYKVAPIVFQAYSEYENNFPLHFLLEIIYSDFVLLRQKMYETLMPIAQVGYKIINAMSH